MTSWKYIVCLLAVFAAACGTDGAEPDNAATGTGTDYDEAGIEAWGDSYDERLSGKADNAGCSGVLVPDRSGFGGRVALTFDDGPNPATTNLVLDVLAANEIKATFFINGNRVNSQAARDALKRIIDEGHILANHSHNHENLGTANLARVEQQVDQTHTIIEAQGVTPLYFRFPFGSSTCATADLVRSFGYRVTGWHVDSADWCFAASRGGVGVCDRATFAHVPDSLRHSMPDLVLSETKRTNGGILLFHDVHRNTADSLDEIIHRLQNDGFTFVNVDDVSTFPMLNNDDLNDFSWTGDACELDEECDYAAAASCLTYGTEEAPAGSCTVPCAGFCDDFPGRAATFCVSLNDGVSGTCLSKSSAQNNFCNDMPGTIATTVPRFVGDSSAPNSVADVCFPQ